MQTSSTRLYTLEWADQNGPALDIEAWWGEEALSEGFEWIIDLLSHDAHLELKSLLGRPLRLLSTLSDGSRTPRSGLVRAALKLDSDGGFARYRLSVVPWFWLLSRARHNRIFQEQTIIQIVDAVFADYPDLAAWHWSDEVSAFIGEARPRSYCVQYGESDYAFISRLLAEEGLGWRVEESANAPAGHRILIFSDSRLWPEDPISQSATGGLGIRFHRADSQEDQDTVLAFGRLRKILPARLSAIGFDYKQKQLVAQSVPAQRPLGGEHAPRLECFEDGALYPWANSAEAERYGRLAMEAIEARYESWQGQSSVRSLRPGTRIDLLGLPVQPGGSPEGRYGVTAVTHLGINNLAGASMADVAQRLARPQVLDHPALTATGDQLFPCQAPAVLPPALLAQASERGYANRFAALATEYPWRPWLNDASGIRPVPRPTAPGPMTAIVVGAEGEAQAQGSDELWCDALGRIKVRFHWQGEAGTAAGQAMDTCWLRVTARQAGPGMGWQWLPRIGQEVLVDFMAGDIDRPSIVAALFNGRGEGGIAATPGGAAGESDTTLFRQAADHRPAAQGNPAGGNAPAWHAAAAADHAHANALSGFRSKEFGGSGYNHWVMDDSQGQLRIQLKTTQHMSELNLGHLIHQADNYRGSFRGTGAELRTDAWGALRAGQGLVMSTWPVDLATPAGDMAPASALLQQAIRLSDTLSQAARHHRSLPLAAVQGCTQAGQCSIDPAAAPLPALHKVASGQVDASDESAAKAEAGQKQTAYRAGSPLPQLTDPAILQAARGGIVQLAGQHLQMASGETLALVSAGDADFAVGGQARFHAGQAIGIAAANSQAPKALGLQLIAARGDIQLEAQRDEIKWQAREHLKLVTATQQIDFAAGKRIVFANQSGASITLDGGITAACPGSITVHASRKSFTGPTSDHYALSVFPQHICVECMLKAMKSGSPFVAPMAA